MEKTKPNEGSYGFEKELYALKEALYALLIVVHKSFFLKDLEEDEAWKIAQRIVDICESLIMGVLHLRGRDEYNPSGFAEELGRIRCGAVTRVLALFRREDG